MERVFPKPESLRGHDIVGTSDLFDDFADAHVAAFSEELFAVEVDQQGRDGKDAEVRGDLRGLGDVDGDDLQLREVHFERLEQFRFEGVADVAGRCAEVEGHGEFGAEGLFNRV